MISAKAYLTFDGNCEEAMNFYAGLLGAKILMMMKAKGSPMEEHTPPELHDKIMHARIQVGNSLIMGSDSFHPYKVPQGFRLTLNVDEPAEADRVFAGLAEGGKVGMALQETYWAHRFGDCIDRFGTPWLINCEKPQQA